MVKNISDEYDETMLTYNSSGKLIAAQDDYDDTFYTWEGEKLTKIGSETFSYSEGKTCKGFSPMIAFRMCWNVGDLYSDNPILIFAHPELFGARNIHLPDKMIVENDRTYSFSYTLDNDGYVKTITDDSGSIVMTFTWK